MSLGKELKEKILRAVDPERVTELARQYIPIRSFSGQEKESAVYMYGKMKELGMDAQLQEVEPNRPNAIGTWRGTGGGPSLVLAGHLDHNMVCEGWKKDPFGGVIEDGWLYGFVHMRSANIAYIAAVEALRKAGVSLKGDLILDYNVGELQGGVGVMYALKNGLKGDFYVIGEPTDLGIVTMHAGIVITKIHTLGAMKHFGTPLPPGSKPRNAIQKMAKFVLAVGESHTPIPPGRWLSFKPRTGWERMPQLNIGSIRGGISRRYEDWRPALVSDFCTVTLDVRTAPGMNQTTVLQDIKNLLEKLKAEDPDFQYEIEPQRLGFPDEAYEEPSDSYIFKSISANQEYVTGEKPKINARFPPAGDEHHLHHAGILGVTYGPMLTYLSRPDERVRVEDIVKATKVYALTIADVCNQSRSQVVKTR